MISRALCLVKIPTIKVSFEMMCLVGIVVELFGTYVCAGMLTGMAQSTIARARLNAELLETEQLGRSQVGRSRASVSVSGVDHPTADVPCTRVSHG